MQFASPYPGSKYCWFVKLPQWTIINSLTILPPHEVREDGERFINVLVLQHYKMLWAIAESDI